MKIKLLKACICLFVFLQACKKDESTNSNADLAGNSNSKTTAQTLATPPINEWVSIRARHSGKGIQLPGYDISDQTAVIQWTDGGGPNFRFKITSVGTNIYRITPSMPYGLAKCIEIDGASTANGAGLIQNNYTGATNQQWSFVDLGNGYFQIINVNSGKALDVPGASTSDGTQIIQYTPNASAYNQQWSFISRGATTTNVSCNGCTPWQSGFISGSWTMMHRSDNATLSSDGGTSGYVCRYETEYWKGSGAIVLPSIEVLSGTNTKTGQSGTSALGTCTGTAFPSEENYSLNGSVKWTNNESGCAYNLALRSL